MSVFKLTRLRNVLNAINVNRQLATLTTPDNPGADGDMPDKPKKPLTPYFRFMRDFRRDYLRHDPNGKTTDIVKEGAAKWNTIPTDIKAKYTQEYEAEKEDYLSRITEYKSSLTEEQKERLLEAKRDKVAMKQKKELRKKLKQSDKPKRPMGPYMQFLMEHAKKSQKSLFLLTNELKGQWQALPESEKQRYIRLYEQDKKRYESEMTKWEQKMIAEGNTDLIRQSSLPTATPSRLSIADKTKKQ